jgi:hypothetical protein
MTRDACASWQRQPGRVPSRWDSLRASGADDLLVLPRYFAIGDYHLQLVDHYARVEAL